MLIKKKLDKYIEFAMTKIYLLVEQKHFEFNNVKLKYLFKKENSDRLIIVLSSCTRKGIKARYNYRRTLQSIKCNQMFILDDFSKDKRGSYYIGANMQFDEEKATHKLIQQIIKEHNIKKICFCGSSKGGWSALNFGLEYDNAFVVSGGPQYLLGDYLLQSENNHTLSHIVGEVTEDKIDFLNHYLQGKILNNEKIQGQRIFLHYSDQEHTYMEHIQYLLEDLNKKQYNVVCDVADYTDHSQISFYFPEFLVKTIENHF